MSGEDFGRAAARGKEFFSSFDYRERQAPGVVPGNRSQAKRRLANRWFDLAVQQSTDGAMVTRSIRIGMERMVELRGGG